MLYPTLTNCTDNSNIANLIIKINCKLAELGNKLYQNDSFLLNNKINNCDLQRLLFYKQILLKKYKNNDYLKCYNNQIIHNKIINLTISCKSFCFLPEECFEII